MEHDIFERRRGVSLAPVSRPTGLISWLDTQTNNKQMQKTVSDTSSEQCRALLTKSALENVAVLSALESNLNQIAPGGVNRYNMLINAYTMSAAQRIVRY